MHLSRFKPRLASFKKLQASSKISTPRLRGLVPMMSTTYGSGHKGNDNNYDNIISL